MPGLVPLIISLYNVFTEQNENVDIQGVELENGFIYFNTDRNFRKWPDGTVEIYYPNEDRWGIYDGDIEISNTNNTVYTGSEVAAIVSGGSGTAPTFALENAIQIGIAIARDNHYGYNWNSGNYANYEGRCGGWYAYEHNISGIPVNQYVNGDFDCSSFVAFLMYKAHIFPEPMSQWFNTVTDNLGYRLKAHGFREYSIPTSGLQMQRGDILLRQFGSRAAGTYSGHTALCIGSGEIVHAKNNTFGDPNDRVLQAKYKERGDYLGHELVTQPSSLNEWHHLYRWAG